MELLPCPFCGGKATFDHDDNGWYWIVCEKCWVSTDCRVSAMDDCKPLLAEAWNRRASPASVPEGFKHDIGADRFTVVHGSYWWHVRAGEGTQNIGKFHTKRAAEEMALTLLTAFRDGAFMQYQAMLAAAPTPPVSEERKDAEIERLNSECDRLAKAASKNYRDNGLSINEEFYKQAEMIEKQSAALKLASLALSEGVEYVEEPPEKNCTCHLAPPCNDCVDHSAVREFFIDARKSIAAIDALKGE